MMADVMNEFSSSNGEVDDGNVAIKLNGDACEDASNITENSPSLQIDDEHQDLISSKDKLCSSTMKKLDCKDADSGLNSKLHEQPNSLKSSAVANGRLKPSCENDENNSTKDDNCDGQQPPFDAVAKKLVCDATSKNTSSETNERVIADAGDNCDSDKAESRRRSNLKSDDNVADLSITKEDSSPCSIVNSQSSSISISIVEENGAKSDGDIVATDLSKRSHDSSTTASDAEKKINANGADEDDEANEDDEVISISSTPDRSKKSSKKPSMSIVNITPRRSSRNINKQQKCYTEKDGGDFERTDSDGVSIIPAKKRVTGSSGDDEIEEITPTDPLAEEPNRPSPSAGAKMRNKTIVVSDTKGLVEFASNTKASRSNKKEPTLVIIDTNSILSGRGPIPVSQHASSNSMLHSSSSSTPIPVSLPIPAGAFANATRGSTPSSSAFSVIPIGLPAQGMYSQYKNPPPAIKPIVVGAPSTSVTPVPHPSTVANTLSSTTITTVASTQPTNKQPPVILPSLTDDMFVVEAPSFIVPYVYEKPPMKSLKEHIEKIETDLKAAAAEEAQQREQQELAEAKETAEKTTQNDNEEMSTSKDTVTASSNDKTDKEIDTNKVDASGDHSEESDKDGEQTAENQTKEQDKSADKKDTAKQDESEPMEVDGAAPAKPSAAIVEPETITNNIVKKMEIDSPVNAVKEIEKKITAGPTTGTDDPKKPASYFDNPLGKFFMQIGLNLVQEHVQTDLLRSQKRKRDKEGNKCSQDVHSAIDELTKTLESSKENNDPFKLELKKCELCSFKTESLLVMAHHLETPHMKNYTYRCNFCPLEVRSPHDILFHMEAEHNIRGRLERAPAFHQCPNCPFEDNQKGKLTRHLISCSKKYRPERNQEPPLDWEPPAKIPRVTRNRPPSMSPGNAVYQAAMSGLKQVPQNTLLPKLMPSTTNMKHNMLNVANKRPNVTNAFLNRFPNASTTQPNFQQRPPISMPAANQNMMFRTGGGTNSQTPVLLPQGYHLSGAQIYQTQSKNSQSTQQNLAAAKLLNQPSISITPLPRQSSSNNSSNNAKSGAAKPMNAIAGGNKNAGNFVVCEICDGYIKDLEQLRNHMQWIHKVKIHPKMIYNRPPLNCQKCQERFFTDQGLERHLLGAHGLVTSSMQEAANKGKDGGRCPVCGRVYQWKLLNHVARDHQMALKPAHLSYKCTVCTATFGMYKQFESHVYSAHSVVAKRAMDTSKKPPSGPSSSQNDTLLKPLKINDEITIIPQPVRSSRPTNKESNAATITKTVTSSKKMTCENDNSSNRQDEQADVDDRLCKCICSKEDFAGDEEFRRHIYEKHLKNFKIVLSRLDLKSYNRIPNKENAFKLTKFDRNVISNDIRSTYKLSDFFIEIKRHKLSNDCMYKVFETREHSDDQVVRDYMHLVPELVYAVEVQSENGDKNTQKKQGRVSTASTLYVKRKIESLLSTSTSTKPKAVSNRITVGSSAAAAAYLFNGGKQKRLISRGRRNAARQNVCKKSVNSNEFDSSSDDDVTYKKRRPLSSHQNTAPALNSFNDHFMTGLTRFPQLPTTTSSHDHSYSYSSTSCSMLSQRTVTTTHKTTQSASPARQFASRGNSSSSPYTVVNQQTVTMSQSRISQSRATFGRTGVRLTGLSKTNSNANASNAQFCRQSSVKVTRRLTTYRAEPATRKQQFHKSRPAFQKVVNDPEPQTVISLLSDSDESAVEIVESDLAVPNTNDNEVYILPT